MSELRNDPIVPRWVIIAPERAKRPIMLSDETLEIDAGPDPFEEGNEHQTPPEVLAYREPGTSANGPGWRVRVVPNKFPALQQEFILESHNDGFFERMNGVGAHEVIIECPHNEANLSRLPVDNIREVLCAYHDRLIELKRDSRLAHALVFKNKGMVAGASLHHSHSQLIATPFVPSAIAEEIGGALEFFRNRGRSFFDEVIERELASGARVVLESNGYFAFCPFASRFPFETWILPRLPGSHFENTPPQRFEELARVLKTVLRKLEVALDDPAYNFMLHTAPFHQSELPHYQWHFEIFPRLTRVAGFEWGTGCYINPMPPEDAAKLLREAQI